MNVAKKGIVVL